MLDNACRGDLSGLMSAHAVGDGPESALWLLEAGILVDLADQARMGPGGRRPLDRVGFDAHADQPSLKLTAFWPATTLITALLAELLMSMVCI